MSAKQVETCVRRLWLAKDDSPIGQVWLFYSVDPPEMGLGTYDCDTTCLCDRIQLYNEHPLSCLVSPGDCFEVMLVKRKRHTCSPR